MSVKGKADPDPKSVKHVPEPPSPRNRTRVPKTTSTYRTRVQQPSTRNRSHSVKHEPELHSQRHTVLPRSSPEWRPLAVNHGLWR